MVPAKGVLRQPVTPKPTWAMSGARAALALSHWLEAKAADWLIDQAAAWAAPPFSSGSPASTQSCFPAP